MLGLGIHFLLLTLWRHALLQDWLALSLVSFLDFPDLLLVADVLLGFLLQVVLRAR